MKKITKVVIPAAGFGTRFLPQTKAMPKEMLPVVDKPVIQYVVEEAVSSGIEDVIHKCFLKNQSGIIIKIQPNINHFFNFFYCWFTVS